MTANIKTYNGYGQTRSVTDVERYGVDGKVIELAAIDVRHLYGSIHVQVKTPRSCKSFSMSVEDFAFLARALPAEAIHDLADWAGAR
jgi:hypothetical protein